MRPAREEEHPVGVLRGERQIVHRGHERQSLSLAQPVEKLERLLLVPDVERGRRLVEQDDRRLLGEGARDDGALALAAGERPERRSASSVELETLERVPGGVAIRGTLACERPEVRRPSHQHVLGDGEPRRRLGRLRDDREEPRALAPIERRGVPAEKRHAPVVRQQAGDRAEKRRLAGAVRPDQGDPLAALDRGRRRRRRPRGRRAPPSRPSSPIAVTPGLHGCAGRSAKNGAPKSAVITPIGTSAGASAVRATTSARIEEPRADDERQRQETAVRGAGDESDRVRDDDPDEGDQPADRDGRRRADRRGDDEREPRRAARPLPRLAASRSPRLEHVDDAAQRDDHRASRRGRTAGAATTSLQPVFGRLPRIHDVTSCSVSVFCCWTNVCSAVKKLATVTPARTSVAASRSRPAARPIA